MLFIISMLSSVFIVARGAISVTTEPTSVSVQKGTSATISCIVTDNAFSDRVDWKKGDAVIVQNGQLAPEYQSKFRLEANVEFKLTLISAEATDDGQYSCVVNDRAYPFTITFLDPTDKVEIKWLIGPSEIGTSTLQCSASRSKPPAGFRVYKGNAELTNQVTRVAPTDAQGYGTATSTIIVSLTKTDDKTQMHCDATYPGYVGTYRRESLTIEFTSSSSILVPGLLLIPTLLSLTLFTAN